ncbi:protein NRT1/ PTR FAMILY 7.3-like [Wolffia australiana]
MNVPGQGSETTFKSLGVETKGMIESGLTEDGSLDFKGNPAIKSKSGGWRSASVLLANQGLATLAFFGVGVNLVLFLTRVLHQDVAEAANNVSKWTGTVYIFSLIGAFMSDSYWGRYLTCAVFQVIFILGLVLLALASWLVLVKPADCGDEVIECAPATVAGTSAFYAAIYLIAFGNGGYQPAVATFGPDQFDDNDPDEAHSKVVFFTYFYFALNGGSLVSNTVLAYYENAGRWALGFWASAASAIAALLLFLAGKRRYRHFRPCGNPLTRISQVLVAAARKCHVPPSPQPADLYELAGKQSAIAGSRKILHSDDFRFLDKAATATAEDWAADGGPDPWRLCTVTQVEEVKCVLKLIPIWVCTIMYSAVFTQMSSLFVEQGDKMDTRLGGFHVPPSSMSVFDILSVLLLIVLYQRALARTAGRGLSDLRRIGAGLALAGLAMVAAGLVEGARLARVAAPDRASSLSILWQAPQYALIGASEAFVYVGQLEFFNGQAPDGLKSLGSSLCMASMSFGNYMSSMLVLVVADLTAKDGGLGWIPANLNLGHLDRFFFLLAALTAADLVVYLFCSTWYKRIRLEPSIRATPESLNP